MIHLKFGPVGCQLQWRRDYCIVQSSADPIELGVFAALDNGNRYMVLFRAITADGKVSMHCKEGNVSRTISVVNAPESVQQRTLSEGDLLSIQLVLDTISTGIAMTLAINGKELVDGLGTTAKIMMPSRGNYFPFIDWTGTWTAFQVLE